MPDLPASRALDEPHPSRLAADDPRRAEILVAHRDAMAAGEAGYPDPATGLFVFTAAYLTRAGNVLRLGVSPLPLHLMTGVA